MMQKSHMKKKKGIAHRFTLFCFKGSVMTLSSLQIDFHSKSEKLMGTCVCVEGAKTHLWHILENSICIELKPANCWHCSFKSS